MTKCFCGVELTWENKTICTKCGIDMCEDCATKNKWKCTKCADKQKIKIPDVIRRSSIEDYKSCPYYFKLHVIDGMCSSICLRKHISICCRSSGLL